MNANDLEQIYKASQGSSVPIDMPFEQFSNLSDDDKSKYIMGQYETNVLNAIDGPGDSEFSDDLLSNKNEVNLFDDDDDDSNPIKALEQTSDNTSTVSNTFSGGTYEIEGGDTLSGIAVSNKPEGVSTNDYISQIKALNNMSGDNIQVGQQLILPGSFEALEKEISASDEMRMANYGWDDDGDGEPDTYKGSAHLDQLMTDVNGWDRTKHLDGLSFGAFEDVMNQEGITDSSTINAYKDEVYDRIMNPETHEQGVELMNEVIAKVQTLISNAELDGDMKKAAFLKGNYLSALNSQMDFIQNNLTEKYSQYNNELKRRQ